MIQRMIQYALMLSSRVGADPDDSDDRRVQKSSLVIAAFMFIFVGALWGILYFVLGQPVAGVLPLSYALISFFSTVVFHFTRRYEAFVFSQLLLILFTPFLLMIALGGFVASSGVILWSVFSPLSALIFDTPRRALRWLAAYLVLILASGYLEFHPLAHSPLPPGLRTLFFVMNIGAVSAIVVTLLAYFVSQKNRLFELLQDERAKSENLLLNILPREIAAILKNESRTIADHYDDVSILFADMVGFTPLSAELPPVEMVELLNEAFSFFDSLVDKYDVEKIRTIGDSYMVAAGVPRGRADHAQTLVRMALEMRSFAASHVFHNGRRISFRIGINSGSVIGGVIGLRKFVYDVWGDAVNIASRMESQGLGGAIQITRATFNLIKDEFVCKPRGTIKVKGRGEMETWLVLSAK